VNIFHVCVKCSSCLQHCKNYKNQTSFSRVMITNVLPCFFTNHSVCALHTILHSTDQIIFPLTLQTITIAPIMSIWGKGDCDRMPFLTPTKKITHRTSSFLQPQSDSRWKGHVSHYVGTLAPSLEVNFCTNISKKKPDSNRHRKRALYTHTVIFNSYSKIINSKYTKK